MVYTTRMAINIPVDSEYWTSQTHWYSPYLDVAAVAAVLELQETTVRQYAAREVPGFPAPLDREGGKNYWSADQILRYIDTERPQLRHRIPRLYAPANLNPAVFLFAERLTVERWPGATVDVAVHHWQPSDGRGPIAVAYPGPLDEPGWKLAPKLLDRLPTVTGVAVVTSEISPLPRRQGWQAALSVAERGNPPLAALGFNNAHGQWAEMGWYELASLLRQDLPWWSRQLLDVDEMTNWFPGAPRQHIRPRSRFYDESMLRRLVTHVPQQDAGRVGDLADRLNRLLEGHINDELPVGEEHERPGLVQAAEPLYRLSDVPPIPDEHEIGWLLQRPVTDPLVADTAATILRSARALEPLVADTIEISTDRGALATEWLQDCENTAPISDELGFAITRQVVPATQRVTSYRKHRRNPLAWIVETDADSFYATVGTKVPATGQLCEFELAEDSAFFRDSTGVVWPMPAPDRGCYYSSGYGGTGPNDLYKAVNALRSDAACDISAIHSREPRETRSRLWRHIVHTKPPMAVTKDELAALTRNEGAAPATG